jgi:hypothetical protein
MVEQCKLCKNVYRNRLYNFLIVADVFDWFTDRRGVRSEKQIEFKMSCVKNRKKNNRLK